MSLIADRVMAALMAALAPQACSALWAFLLDCMRQLPKMSFSQLAPAL